MADAEATTVAPVSAEEARAAAKSRARHLYWQGWRITHIALHLEQPRTTVEEWRRAEKWDDARPKDRVEGALEARIVQLVAKEGKTGGDFKELDLLFRQMERMARVERYEQTGKEGDLNPNLAKRNEGPKRKPKRNHFTEEQIEQLEAAFDESLFAYQRRWYENRHQRTRMLLKSRQIGATWYFAREALLDALKTGHNKIFLSASKAQAHVFRQYMQQFAMDVCGVELTGDPITLSNGATLYFLGTNARTAQSYHGDLYIDEFFWIHGFAELHKVASGMAMHAKWKKTLFSTPSAVTHEAYQFWTGERHNKNRAKDQHIKVDTSHALLSGGFTGEDRVWRNIVNVIDALNGGCDLFDLDELRLEYSEEDFNNLLMCAFIDDTQSVFPLLQLQRCMVDSWEIWHDLKPGAARPFAWKPVWVGYDPSKTGDNAGCVVLAPPDVPGGKFRVLERHQFRGLSFEQQAEEIQKLTKQYNVTYVGIDSTGGFGAAVAELVRVFFPAVTELIYSLDLKTRMVLKAQSVIAAGRLEFDAGWTDLAHSFMSIRRTLTQSGRNVTYEAGRTEATGHADLAWACMHALHHEPLEGQTATNQGFMEIC
jgi:uncharacterized protein YjcR